MMPPLIDVDRSVDETTELTRTHRSCDVSGGQPDRATTIGRVTQPVLVVLAGLPGTGKTTLGQLLAAELGAAYLRIDAIETAVIRCGLAQAPVGPVGYVIAHDVAAATLALGKSVVVDAVNPVPEARAGWHALASSALPQSR
jgi:DNA polymerase III delta prime subunit